MNAQQKELLQRLAKTPEGRALKVYLDGAIEELRDLQTIKSWDETQGRKWAETYIKQLFSFMEEKKTVERIKSQYV